MLSYGNHGVDIVRLISSICNMDESCANSCFDLVIILSYWRLILSNLVISGESLFRLEFMMVFENNK